MSETALSSATQAAVAHRAPTRRVDLVAMMLCLGIGAGLIRRPYVTGQMMPGPITDPRLSRGNQPEAIGWAGPIMAANLLTHVRSQQAATHFPFVLDHYIYTAIMIGVRLWRP